MTALPAIVFKTVSLSPRFSLLLLHCSASAPLLLPGPERTGSCRATPNYRGQQTLLDRSAIIRYVHTMPHGSETAPTQVALKFCMLSEKCRFVFARCLKVLVHNFLNYLNSIMKTWCILILSLLAINVPSKLKDYHNYNQKQLIHLLAFTHSLIRLLAQDTVLGGCGIEG